MRLKLCLLLLWIWGALAGQSIQGTINELVSDPRLRGASIAVDVIDLDDGKRVAAHRPDLSLIPASTQKLLLTGAALDLLGSETTFSTELVISGRIEAGTLYGNLWIVGGGDPTLASPEMPGAKPATEVLARWVAAVRAAGIQRINGAVIGDDTRFGTDGAGADWPWSDLGNYYGAGAYGLNWHDNLYYLDLTQRQRTGSRPPVQRTRPIVAGLSIENELRSGPRGSGDNAYLYGAPFNYRHFLRGTIPAGTGRFTIKGSLPDPALQAAHELTETLLAAGIRVDGPPTNGRANGGVPATGVRTLDRLSSPSVRDIAGRTNFKSVNLYAETLLRQINAARGRPEHELSTTEELMDYYGQQLGLDVASVHLLDGSGLSPRNYFPPSFMTAFLRAKQNDEVFRASIPVAGRSGSMRRRLRGTAAEGRLYSKSGSLHGARAFAGYAFPADGRRLAFCIMVNNYTLEGAELSARLYAFQERLCQLR